MKRNSRRLAQGLLPALLVFLLTACATGVEIVEPAKPELPQLTVQRPVLDVQALALKPVTEAELLTNYNIVVRYSLDQDEYIDALEKRTDILEQYYNAPP